MILRTLVANWLQQQAKEQLFDAARESLGKTNRPSEESIPRPPCEVAIVMAVGVEAGGLIDLLADRVSTHGAAFQEHVGFIHSVPIVVVESGAGQSASARAVHDMLVVHRLKWVISAGFATALDTDLKRGDILMADEVVDSANQLHAVDLRVDRTSLAGQRALHIGRLLTVDRLLRSAEEKRQLRDQHAALACDMESMAVARACHERQVGFLSVRIINETVEEEIPKDVQRMLDQKSLAAKFGAAAATLLNRPTAAKTMWQFQEDAMRASDRLARFLAGVVANLPVSRIDAPSQSADPPTSP